jgi:hypothetical protein
MMTEIKGSLDVTSSTGLLIAIFQPASIRMSRRK